MRKCCKGIVFFWCDMRTAKVSRFNMKVTRYCRTPTVSILTGPGLVVTKAIILMQHCATSPDRHYRLGKKSCKVVWKEIRHQFTQLTSFSWDIELNHTHIESTTDKKLLKWIEIVCRQINEKKACILHLFFIPYSVNDV